MAEETIVFARKASGLVREMSWLDVLLITIAGPAASGMTYYAVKQPGIYPGGNMVLAFLLGGLLWLLPVMLVAIYASSFPRSGAMYVVISRATHPFLGFLPNWLWVISNGFSVGFLNYIMLNILSSCVLVAGQMSGSSSMINAGEWLSGNYNRLYIALAATVVIWFFELRGMDRLKWFIRVLVYVPLVLSIVALVIMAVSDGAKSVQRRVRRRCVCEDQSGRPGAGHPGRHAEHVGRHQRHAHGRLLGLHRPWRRSPSSAARSRPRVRASCVA